MKNGKGDRNRSTSKYAENFDSIFNKKPEEAADDHFTTPVPDKPDGVGDGTGCDVCGMPLDDSDDGSVHAKCKKQWVWGADSYDASMSEKQVLEQINEFVTNHLNETLADGIDVLVDPDGSKYRIYFGVKSLSRIHK
jgi:hypothetical protein